MGLSTLAKRAFFIPNASVQSSLMDKSKLMNKYHMLITKLHAPSKFFFSGALMMGMFPLPGLQLMLPTMLPKPTAQVVMEENVETASVGIDLANTFFGIEAVKAGNKTSIEKQIEFVSTRKAYSASLSVVQKHASTIKREASKHNVPEDVAFGVALLENGGSETAVSPAGALGVFQLMPGTARGLGLTVNKTQDDRKNPGVNIEAGVRYLASNYQRFGDWGLATWAYHAGEGNVSKAIKIYAKANHGVNLGGVKDASGTRAYVEKHGITIHKLLSDSSVKKFTSKLNDDSSGYPYKVIATATLFKNADKAKKSNPQTARASVIGM